MNHCSQCFLSLSFTCLLILCHIMMLIRVQLAFTCSEKGQGAKSLQTILGAANLVHSRCAELEFMYVYVCRSHVIRACVVSVSVCSLSFFFGNITNIDRPKSNNQYYANIAYTIQIANLILYQRKFSIPKLIVSSAESDPAPNVCVQKILLYKT